ncbi:MAG: radical SAM protein [Bacteroidales bacterium]|nr:radical SAM protein [Bacteroidales bacterium]
MNTVYHLLRLNRFIRNRSVKKFGIFVLHLLGGRYLAVFLDPVLACNLRCKMCYFSDPEYRKRAKGMLNPDDLPKMAHAFFRRTLKLQIGCGAEPSLFPHNTALIRLAKQYKIPYIAMTTNGNLFTDRDLHDFAEAGLNEITLSLHGVTRESYEYFMTGGSFDAFCKTMAILTEIKKAYPHFKVRVNYTVNQDNMKELSLFFDVFGNYAIDILQIRPIQKIGASEYHSFSWDELYRSYDEVIKKVRDDSRRYGVVCIAPEKEDLQNVGGDESVVEATYCYISPQYVWREDFDLDKETYQSYSKRTKRSKMLFNNIFKKDTSAIDNHKRLNYSIQ